MNELAQAYWERAVKTLEIATTVLTIDATTSASRSYYAAFYAVSALFLLDGKKFKKHKALEAAIHRDLINTGRWPQEGGKEFTYLMDIRTSADYTLTRVISPEMAQHALTYAQSIVRRVAATRPDVFRFEV